MKKSLRKSHFSIARLMLLAIVLILFTATLLKQDPDRLEPPVKLSGSAAFNVEGLT